MGWEPFLEEGQMCGSVGVSIFSVCGLRVGFMCASDVIQLEIFAFLDPVRAITRLKEQKTKQKIIELLSDGECSTQKWRLR